MSTRRVESFLLRIVVPEDVTPRPECWRGRIQHITTGDELQVDELAQAIAFITAYLAPHSNVVLEIEQQTADS